MQHSIWTALLWKCCPHQNILLLLEWKVSAFGVLGVYLFSYIAVMTFQYFFCSATLQNLNFLCVHDHCYKFMLNFRCYKYKIQVENWHNVGWNVKFLY